MWALLAGVPGRLKTLIDRLTATRAANLDNLNATVSSRAPADTALSTATWTGTRAGKLDSIDAAVSTRMPGTTTHRDRIDDTISSRMPGTTVHRDRIDAAISSRAAAATALSNTVWTNARAALLDKLDSLPSADGLAPVAGGLYPSTQSVSGASPDANGFTLLSSRTTVGTLTVIDIAGAGVLQYAALRITTPSAGGQNIAAELRVTIDGIAHSVSLSSTASNANITRYLVGYVNGAAIALDAVPFNASLKIELIVSANNGGTAWGHYKLRRVA